MGTRRSVPVSRPTAARPADLPANAGAAMAAVLFGGSVVAVRVAVRDVPPISLAVLRIGQGGLLLGRIAGERLAWRQVAGVGLSVAGIALAFVEPGRAIDADAMSLVGDGLLLLTGLLGLVVFLGVLGGSAAFLLWTWALSRLTPTQVAVYVNNPIVAALLAILLLDERRSGLFLVGFAAVLTGVLLVNWPAHRPWAGGRVAAGRSPLAQAGRSARGRVGAIRSSVR
jgi:drug/metabolite transporter (DMT)-like permease